MIPVDAVARQRQLRTVKRILDDPDNLQHARLVELVADAAIFDPPDDFQTDGGAA